MEPQEWQQQQREIRDALVGHLIDRISRDTYPSTTMLDMIEQSMGPEHVAAYAEALMDKIRQDEFPSLALIDRVSGLV
ncbi:hypothetical protein ncot_11045 [Nocardioides sp. JQ2195]|uniref:hypothetical protein n=1 Tax=Nocardioides sp. JQ2195 TaxID=2592334 RepID=UPI00143E5EC2|nr:hypothetical protein [Nocardioides sp. JQ2195]QIX27071.1 hypothetical protein ncot_11045 [Nocardioides sp. JQ2195]